MHMVQLLPLHPKTQSSLASFKSVLVLPFWYQLTRVVLKKEAIKWVQSVPFARQQHMFARHIGSQQSQC